MSPKLVDGVISTFMQTKIQLFLIRYRREISATLAAIGILLLISIIRAATPTVYAITTIKDLPAGHKITSSDLSSKKIPSSLTWSTLVTQTDSVVGKVTSHALTTGTPISNSDLISSDLLTGFESNQIAISIPVSGNRVDAYLTSGNHINVYATQNGEPAKLVAYDAVVLFVPPNKSGGFQISSGSENSVILAVNQGESVEISTYVGNGTFSFALLPNN